MSTATVDAPTEPQQPVEPKLTPLLCRRCDRLLAITDGRVLQVGAVLFLRAVTMNCACGERRSWRPGGKSMETDT